MLQDKFNESMLMAYGQEKTKEEESIQSKEEGPTYQHEDRPDMQTNENLWLLIPKQDQDHLLTISMLHAPG